jgi:hypothetical protein
MLQALSEKEVPVFSQHEIEEKLIRLEENIRKLASETIEGQWIAVTVDHWTSKEKHNYTGMTVHWLDEKMQLHSLKLGCFLQEGGSEGDKLVDDFLVKLFVDAGLEKANIVAVVSDTTANLNNFGKLIEKLNIHHICCIDHCLQLAAKLAYEDKMCSQHGDDVEDVVDDRILLDELEIQTMKKA